MRSKLSTEVGRRILHAVSTFGAYLVDDAAGNGLGDVNINYEVGVAAEVLELYGIQMLPSVRPNRTPPLPGERALYSDLVAIFQVRSFLLVPRVSHSSWQRFVLPFLWKPLTRGRTQALHAVVNNGPDSVGGGGEPIVPPPPDLCAPPQPLELRRQ